MQFLRKFIIRSLLLCVIPLAVIAIGGDYWLKSTRYVTTDNAYIKAPQLAVSSDIDGRAIKVLAKENDRVEQGDLLFILDPEPLRILVEKSEAMLAGIRNILNAFKAEYRQVQAEIVDAKQDVAYHTESSIDNENCLQEVFYHVLNLMQLNVTWRNQDNLNVL